MPPASFFSQEEIDRVLRFGSNAELTREYIVDAFQQQKEPYEVGYLLHERFHGGAGFYGAQGAYSAWYAEDGIYLHRGKSARYAKNAQVIRWENAAERIGQLIAQGEYTTQEEIDRAKGSVRSQIAQRIVHLYSDMSQEARAQGYLSCLDNLPSGNPAAVAELSQRMTDPDFLITLADQEAKFFSAYLSDKALMRYQIRDPYALYLHTMDLSRPRLQFVSILAELPANPQFITEDEINESLRGGSYVSHSKDRITAFFADEHTAKEQSDFLKNEYGTGGHSHAISGTGWMNYDSRGIFLTKEGCEKVNLRWPSVAKRVSDMIKMDRYLDSRAQAMLHPGQNPELDHEAEKAIDAPEAEFGADGTRVFGAEDTAPENRYHVIEVDWYPGRMAYAIWDDLANGYYEDKDGLTVDFTSRWQAEEYRNTLTEQTVRNFSFEYQLLDRLRTDCEYFLNAGGRNEQHLWSGNVREHIAKMQELYELLPEKPEWLTTEAIDSYALQMQPRFSVVVYHHFENSFDEKLDYQTVEQAEKAAIGYILGTMEGDGFRYDGAAVYDRESEKYIRMYGDYPDDVANAQVSEAVANQPNSLKFSIGFSEHPAFYARDNGEFHDRYTDLTFALGNKLLGVLDEKQHRERERENNHVGWYHKTDFTIQVVIDGNAHSYEGRFDIGDGEGDLIAHIRNYIEYCLNSNCPYIPMWKSRGDDFCHEKIETLEWNRDVFLPYLEQNAALTAEDRKLFDEIMSHEPEWFRSPAAEAPAEQEEEQEEQAVSPASTVIDGHVVTFPTTAAMEMAQALHQIPDFPCQAGDTVYLEEGKPYIIDEIGRFDVRLRDPEQDYPILRTERRESLLRLMECYPQNQHIETSVPQISEETVDFFPAENSGLPFDVEIRKIHFGEPEHSNFRIKDMHLGEGGAKEKYRWNIQAIHTLQALESEHRYATPEEQEVLSRYVGWGALADAFDPNNPAWMQEFQELKNQLTEEEYAAARASTLNAHYTSPTVIQAIWEAVGNMGFQTGNILEPAMGVGNFFGLLPEGMAGSKLYGVELDSVSGRIAQKLYPNANITIAGFETTNRQDYFDLAVGNVPFGDYKVNDRRFNRLGFSIHNYFFAKALDQVRPGGVIAFVTSRYTMDAKNSKVRKYLAERADLLGAIRLPNNAFRANAGTDVVSDIIFLQKREHPIDIEPDWVYLGQTPDGLTLNSYFIDHPEMILGELATESTQYGREECTVIPIPGADLAQQLHEAVGHLQGIYRAAKMQAQDEAVDEPRAETTRPASPDVKNFSYALVDGDIYFREDSVMQLVEMRPAAKERAKGMIALREILTDLINFQVEDYPEDEIAAKRAELNKAYDKFTANYGEINSRANAKAFAEDSSYYLLCSLENVDDDGMVTGKADMFFKRTIRPEIHITSVDTPSEALAVSIGEKAKVDMPFMEELTGKTEEEIYNSLQGVIFLNPKDKGQYLMADEYLSGNVRQKLQEAQAAAEADSAYAINVSALEQVQPKDLTAAEIDVQLGATWIDKKYIQQFMEETFKPPYPLRRSIQVQYSPLTAGWDITGKSLPSHNDVNAYMAYGTKRANAYLILENTLNLRDIRITDTVEDANGSRRQVLNQRETTIARQKQEAIKAAFRDWIWKDLWRRDTLCKQYNEIFNSIRPREYDGSHLQLAGMNPEIELREHQKTAIARILYGGNTLLAHEVGAGKTFEMAAAAMEGKRLGLSRNPCLSCRITW